MHLNRYSFSYFQCVRLLPLNSYASRLIFIFETFILAANPRGSNAKFVGPGEIKRWVNKLISHGNHCGTNTVPEAWCNTLEHSRVDPTLTLYSRVRYFYNAMNFFNIFSQCSTAVPTIFCVITIYLTALNKYEPYTAICDLIGLGYQLLWVPL